MANIESTTIIPHGLSGRQSPAHVPSRRNVLGVDVSVLTRKAALAFISARIATKTHIKFSFLNAHGANIAWGNAQYRQVLSNFEVLADGVGVDINSMINYGEKFPDNLNGTDFVPAMLSFLKNGVSVALLGGEPGIAEKAAALMGEKHPQHDFTVIENGYFNSAEESEILDRLSELKPDILLVAMGNPLQENWILEHCSENNCTIAFGVGAYFDFIAERISRAPAIFRRLRIEWLYRLWLEPGRMWRRYLVGNPVFLVRSIMQRFIHMRNEVYKR